MATGTPFFGDFAPRGTGRPVLREHTRPSFSPRTFQSILELGESAVRFVLLAGLFFILLLPVHTPFSVDLLPKTLLPEDDKTIHNNLSPAKPNQVF